MLRECRRCKVKKEETEFSGRIKSACAECNKLIVAEANKKFREKHKEALNEKKKAYIQANKELVAERQKLWHKKNKELNAEKRKLWYLQNKEQVLQERKLYYENNKDLVKERVKAYTRTDKGVKVHKKAISKYYDTKPEKKEEYGIRHFITFVIKPKILFRDNYTCQLCGCKDKDFHCHHIIPVNIAPKRIEDTTNLITLCQDCHIKAHKGDWQNIDLDLQSLLLENKNLQKEILWENKPL